MLWLSSLVPFPSLEIHVGISLIYILGNPQHVLLFCDKILETSHLINAKRNEPFIHIIIKLFVEKCICHGLNSLTAYGVQLKLSDMRDIIPIARFINFNGDR